MIGKKINKLKYTVGALLALSGSAAFACGQDSYMGEVCTMAIQFCPAGTLEAAGQTLQISQYNALYSLLGTAFGGNGQTTFMLPDLRGRSVAGRASGSMPAGVTSLTIGQNAGTTSETITVAQMPSHTHAFTPTATTVNVSLQANSASGKSPAPTSTGNYLAAAASKSSVPADTITTDTWSGAPASGASVAVGGLSATTSGGGGTIGLAGGSQPITTQSPVLGMIQCIVTQGLYPSRP